jgi:excisionase family DNA binding protein
MLRGSPFRTLKSSQTRHKPLQNSALTALSSGWFPLIPGGLRVVPGRRAHLAGMNEPHPFPDLPTRLERLLSVQQLSDYLGVPVKTLYEWRTQHVGPRAVKVGRALRYPESRVAAWLDEQS